jgi:hypothetical protein
VATCTRPSVSDRRKVGGGGGGGSTGGGGEAALLIPGGRWPVAGTRRRPGLKADSGAAVATGRVVDEGVEEDAEVDRLEEEEKRCGSSALLQ